MEWGLGRAHLSLDTLPVVPRPAPDEVTIRRKGVESLPSPSVVPGHSGPLPSSVTYKTSTPPRKSLHRDALSDTHPHPGPGPFPSVPSLRCLCPSDFPSSFVPPCRFDLSLRGWTRAVDDAGSTGQEDGPREDLMPPSPPTSVRLRVQPRILREGRVRIHGPYNTPLQSRGSPRVSQVRQVQIPDRILGPRGVHHGLLRQGVKVRTRTVVVPRPSTDRADLAPVLLTTGHPSRPTGADAQSGPQPGPRRVPEGSCLQDEVTPVSPRTSVVPSGVSHPSIPPGGVSTGEGPSSGR